MVNITVITAPHRLSKRYEVADDQTLNKQPGGQMTEGHYAVHAVADLSEFATLLDELSSHQALCYGIPHGYPTEGPIYAQSCAPSGGLTRTKQHFDWSEGAGILFLDFDHCTLSPQKAVELIRRAAPQLTDADMLWRASGSSGIRHAEGAIDTGVTGQRIYFAVDNATLIPQIGKALVDWFWLNGYGRIETAKNGHLLLRTLIDDTVWQAQRLDFAGPPHLGPGLTRDPPPAWRSGTTPVVDAQAVLDHLTRNNAAPTAQRIRNNQKTLHQKNIKRQRTQELVKQGSTRSEAARQAAAEMRARETRTLDAHTPLYFVERGTVTVADVLANPSDYHNQRLADPSEPDYGNDPRIAVCYSDQPHPIIYSHAHGGQHYALVAPLTPESSSAHRDEGPSRLTASFNHRLSTTFSTDELLKTQAWRIGSQIDAAVFAQLTGIPMPQVHAAEQQIVRRAIAPVHLSEAETIMAEDLERIAHEVATHGGIVLVKAPTGVGKTSILLANIAQQAYLHDQTIVGIAHRQSLVEQLARRLHFTSYRSKTLDDADSLAICIHSLAHPRFDAFLARTQVALVDEISAVLREIHARHGVMTHPDEVRTHLTDLLNHVTAFIGVDADLSDTDVQTLREMTSKPITVYRVAESQRTITTTFATADDHFNRLTPLLNSGQRVLIASDSSRIIDEYALWIKYHFPHLNVHALHSRFGTATTGNPETVALMADINTQATALDCLLFSPSCEAGVSLEVPHFQHHFFFYCGAVAPSVAMQMIARDRTATHWNIGILGSGLRNSGAFTTAGQAEAAHLAAATLAYQAHGIDQTPQLSAFDKASARYEAQAHVTNYAQALWYLLQHRGYTVKRHYTESPTSPHQRHAHNLANQALFKLVDYAPDLTQEEAFILSKRIAVTTLESASLFRYGVTMLFGHVNRRSIEYFQRGKLNAQLHRFMQLTDQSQSPDLMVVTEKHLSISRFESALHRALTELRLYLGIDQTLARADAPDQDGIITPQAALYAFDQMKQRPAGQVLRRANLSKFDKRPEQRPISWLAGIFKKCGLSLDTVGRWGPVGSRYRVYRISTEVKYNRYGQISALGLNLMNWLAHRKNTGSPQMSNSGIMSLYRYWTSPPNPWRAQLGAMLCWLLTPTESASAPPNDGFESQVAEWRTSASPV